MHQNLKICEGLLKRDAPRCQSVFKCAKNAAGTPLPWVIGASTWRQNAAPTVDPWMGAFCVRGGDATMTTKCTHPPPQNKNV